MTTTTARRIIIAEGTNNSCRSSNRKCGSHHCYYDSSYRENHSNQSHQHNRTQARRRFQPLFCNVNEDNNEASWLCSAYTRQKADIPDTLDKVCHHCTSTQNQRKKATDFPEKVCHHLQPPNSGTESTIIRISFKHKDSTKSHRTFCGRVGNDFPTSASDPKLPLDSCPNAQSGCPSKLGIPSTAKNTRSTPFSRSDC